MRFQGSFLSASRLLQAEWTAAFWAVHWLLACSCAFVITQTLLTTVQLAIIESVQSLCTAWHPMSHDVILTFIQTISEKVMV